MMFKSHFTGERRLIFHGGPEGHEPMNAGEYELTYQEQRWQKLADALTAPEQYATTVSTFKHLAKGFGQGKVDMEYLKAAHEYVLSIANQSGMTQDEIRVARPLSMDETYDFVCFVLDSAEHGPSQPGAVQENARDDSAVERTSKGFRRRPSQSVDTRNSNSIYNDPDMIRAREQRNLPIEETDLFKKASPRAQERALRIQQLSRELSEIKERETRIRAAGSRIRELRIRHDKLIGAIKERMKSADTQTREAATKLYGEIRQKERAIEQDVAARWPNYKRPTPSESVYYEADFTARADEWIDRSTHIADSYAALQREIEQRIMQEHAAEMEESSPSDKHPSVREGGEQAESVVTPEPEVEIGSAVKRATTPETPPAIDPPVSRIKRRTRTSVPKVSTKVTNIPASSDTTDRATDSTRVATDKNTKNKSSSKNEIPEPSIETRPSVSSAKRAERTDVPDVTNVSANQLKRTVSDSVPTAQQHIDVTPETQDEHSALHAFIRERYPDLAMAAESAMEKPGAWVRVNPAEAGHVIGWDNESNAFVVRSTTSVNLISIENGSPVLRSNTAFNESVKNLKLSTEEIKSFEEYKKYQKSLNDHLLTRTTARQISDDLKELNTAIKNLQTYPMSTERSSVEFHLNWLKRNNDIFANIDTKYPGRADRLVAARAEMVKVLRAHITDPAVAISQANSYSAEKDTLYIRLDLVKDGKKLGGTSVHLQLKPDGTIMVLDTSAGGMNWNKRYDVPLTSNLPAERIRTALQGSASFSAVGDALGIPQSAMQYYHLDADWTEDDLRALYEGKSLIQGLNNAKQLKSIIEVHNGKPVSFMFHEMVHTPSMVRMLQISVEPNAVNVMRGLLSDRTFNLGFSNEKRTEFDLAKDKSTFKLVCERMANVSPNTPDFAQRVQAEWMMQRDIQWESFKSEEMTPSGPKPTDVLMIYVKEFEGESASMADVFKTLNAFNKNGETKTHMICIEDCVDLDDLNRRIKAVSTAYKESEDRHLAIVLTAHGSNGRAGGRFERGNVALPFRNGKVHADITDISMQQVHSSLFYNPCYGGEHAIGAAKEGKLRTPFWSGAENTVNFSDNITRALNGINAYQEQSADFNQDGKISLGEMRYFMDTDNLYQDSVVIDAHGNRIATIIDKQMAEGLS